VYRASHEHQEEQPPAADEETSLPVSNGDEAEAAIDGPAAGTAIEHGDVQVTVSSFILSLVTTTVR